MASGKNASGAMSAATFAAAQTAAAASASGAAAGTYVGAGVYTQASTAAAFGPWGLIIAVGFVVYSILATSKPKDRRTPGIGFEIRENSTDPNEPIRYVVGAPVYTPPILTQYLTTPDLNSRRPVKSQKLVTVLSLGAGKFDGRDLTLWTDDDLAVSTVNTASLLASRTLSQVPGTAGREWVFPRIGVLQSSVVVYIDDAQASVHGGANGGSVFENVETKYTNRRSKARTFGPSNDTSIPVNHTRHGGRFPHDGIVQDFTVKVVVGNEASSPNVGALLKLKSDRILNTGKHTLTDDEVGRSTTKDGRQYFYMRLASGDTARIDHFKVTYRVKREIEIKRVGTQTHAVFTESQAGSAITATYKTSRFGDNLKYTFYSGSTHQREIKMDNGTRNLFSVGGELVQNAAVTYSTKNEVDDVVIGLRSGSDGFYFRNGDGGTGDAFRHFQIQVRETGASDRVIAFSPGRHRDWVDPSKGWIGLRHPDAPDDEIIEIGGSRTGTAQWAFSVADLLAFTAGDTDGETGQKLKRAKYDVRVIATDKAGWLDGKAAPNRNIDKLFFDTATESFGVRLRLPKHPVLVIEQNVDGNGTEPTYRVGIAAKRVWVPDADAVYDSTTKRPEPGNKVWTRNPVWLACDLIRDKWFGGGHYFDWTHIDLTTALAAAVFCDETVEGETRAELDTVLGHRSALLDHVSQFCAGAQVLPSLSGGTWRFIIDQNAASVMTLTDTDFESATAVLSHISLEESPTDLEGTFTDELNEFDLMPHHVAPKSPEPSRRVTKRVDLTGVRRRSQVNRAMGTALRQMIEQKDVVDVVGSNWRMLLLEAGDIVTVTSTPVNWTAQKARVTAVSWGSNLKVKVRLALHSDNATAGLDNNIVIIQQADTPTVLSSADKPLVPAQLKVSHVSSSWEIDVGSFPAGTTAVDAFVRYEDSTLWRPLPRSTVSPFTVSIGKQSPPRSTRAVVKAHLVRADGRRVPDAIEVPIDLDSPVTDRTDPTTITWPDTEVKQDGAVLEITPQAPAEVDPAEYAFQVHHGTSAAAAKDSVFVGFTDAGKTVKEFAWSGTEDQRIFTRPRRKSDGVTGDWATLDIKVGDATDSNVEDFDGDFTTGTLEGVGASSVPTLEAVGGGGVRFIGGISLDDLSSTSLDDLENVTLDELGAKPTAGTYTTPVIEISGDAETVMFEVQPVVGSISRVNLSLDDLEFQPLCPSDFDGTTVLDNRLRNVSWTLDGDEYPVVVETKVAVSDSGSPTFTDSDFTDLIPGKLYKPKAYAMRHTIRARFGTQVTFSAIKIRRHCRDNWGCSHKPHSFIITESSHGLAKQNVVLNNSSNVWVKAKANAASTVPGFGLVMNVLSTNTARIAVAGRHRLVAHGLTVGTVYYLSDATAGLLTSTKPTTSTNYVQPILVPLDASYIHLFNHREEVIA